MLIKQITAMVLSAGALVALLGCEAPEGTLISGCQAKDGIEPICGLQAPEDMAVLPGDKFILFSQFGTMGERPGSIGLLNTDDNSVEKVFPSDANHSPETLWGDDSCTQAPNNQFSPHGTHMHQLSDGRWRYLVVNHGDREAVEMFEVSMGSSPRLQWRGCVFPADNTIINDVVGLNNGDIVFTRMFHADDSLAVYKSMLGMVTGEVWYWDGKIGLQELPDTRGAMPNGLEISADNRFVFINMYMDEEVQKYDLAARQVIASAAVPNVDNSAWSPEGKLWLASHTGGLVESNACYGDQTKTCGISFEIVELDPQTMAFKTVFSHQGPPMGAATIAVAAGDKVYLGSYAGDRMIIVPRSQFK